MTRKERRLSRALGALRKIADMHGNGAAQIVARIALKDCRLIKNEPRYARPTSGQEGKVEKEQSRERLAYCPTCSAEIKSTERRPDGDSVCVNGHKHKTKEFFHYHPSTGKCGELVKRLRAWQGRPDRDDISAWIEFNAILDEFEKEPRHE